MIGHTDDRGQLILAGAVVFSLVLIGIVVVFSTTLFTANMASSSANAGITDAGGLESDVEATVEDLISKINDDENHEDFEERKDALTNSAEEYEELAAERYGHSGPTIVAIKINEDDIREADEDIDEADVTVVYETRSTTTERTITVEDPDS